jgi:molecular chaperone GrpE
MTDNTSDPATPQNQQDGSATAQTDDSQSEFAALQQELEANKEQLEKLTIISQRALADLQNYKRRTEDEKAGFITFANAELLAAILPSVDNIHRALAHDPKDAEWVKGTEQILTQLIDTLTRLGLKPIETAGAPFDPNLHEALLTGPGPKDQIIAELEKGYTFNDKTIKRSRVSVGNGEAEAPAAAQ